MQKIIVFLQEARGELAKVSWPTRQDIIRNTIIVIAVSGVVAVFLGGLDYLFSLAIKGVLSKYQ